LAKCASGTRPVLQREATVDHFRPTSADLVGLLPGVPTCSPTPGSEPLPRPPWPPADDLDRLVLLYEMGRFDELQAVESALLQ
jgi:hypothetical protein